MGLGQDFMARNRNSSQAQRFDSTKKFLTAPSSGKVILILFFDSKGILQHGQPWKKTVIGVCNANILKTHLRNGIRKKRLELLMKRWFLLDNNA
jgi:hypothetical protein